MAEMTAEDKRMLELFEAAHRDPRLKKQLLTRPMEVAEQWQIELGEQDAEQFVRLGEFLQVAEKFKSRSLYPVCDPRVCYPITVWRHEAVIDIIERWRLVFYPAPFFRRFRHLG